MDSQNQSAPQQDDNQENNGLILDLSLLCNWEVKPTSDDSCNKIGPSDDATEHQVFSCNYCHRNFYTSQALGGHQNAHKRERIRMAKRKQRIGASTADSGMMSNFLHMHGSLHRSLGIQAHSMIQKPHISSTTYGVPAIPPLYNRHSAGTWSRRRLDNQLPAIGRLIVPESLRISFGDGTGRLNFGNINKFPAGVGSHLKTNLQEDLKKLDLSLKL